MSTPINQKEYLKRYLSGPSSDKKKKKKKIAKGKGLVIIDDDVDLSKIRPLDGDELDILGEGEDGPQIAGIIDERPEEVKKLEQFKTSSKWRVINQDDGFNSKVSIEEIKQDIKEQEKENELVFGKMYSDTEDEKNDSDLSPPRTKTKEKSKGTQQNSDSDVSPPRRRDRASPPKHERKRRNSDDSSQRNNDSTKNRVSTHQSSRELPSKHARERQKQKPDNSPHINNDPKSKDRPIPRHESSKDDRQRKNYNSDRFPQSSNDNNKNKDRIRKPSRWGEASDSKNSERHEDRSKNRNSDSDQSPPRKSRKKSQSPARERDGRRIRKESPKQKRRKDSDSDQSPPRKQRTSETSSKKQKHRNNSSDSDLSPPRKRDSKKDYKENSDSDLSPQRKSKPNRDFRNSEKSKRNDSDSDLSPPRRQNDMKRQNDKNSKSDTRRNFRQNSDSPPPSNKKMARTLEGKAAGLQNAKELRKENEDFRQKEDAVFSRMTDDLSGRNATAVSRKSSKRETSEERQKKREKQEIQKMIDEKYKKWNKGIKQVQDSEARLADFVHESSKPLARTAGDCDLEHSLKQVEREGDPMLQYVREKKRERGDLAPEKPTYKGNFPPNRFNIRPGYRWDGVDRSNGYEQKYFETKSKKKAQEEEYYKWCSSDM